MENWKQAKKDLRALGIKVNVSIRGCCMGCVDEKLFEDNEPAIYQLGKRFDRNDGGYLCHQNIAESELAAKVLVVLNKNKIGWNWDGSNREAIKVNF